MLAFEFEFCFSTQNHITVKLECEFENFHVLAYRVAGEQFHVNTHFSCL